MIQPLSFETALAFALAYLLGSIPFGLLMVYWGGLGDIRAIGSGNIGATNVLRTGRKDLALATLLLDGGKGAAAVVTAHFLAPHLMIAAAVGAVFGHLFPIWLRFKGGKGVATTLGVWIALSPLLGAAACLSWLLSAALFRVSSVAALLAIGLAPAYAWLAEWQGWEDKSLWRPALVLALMVIYRHKDNIVRLFKGREPRIGSRKNM